MAYLYIFVFNSLYLMDLLLSFNHTSIVAVLAEFIDMP
jgi:hypothetical protein